MIYKMIYKHNKQFISSSTDHTSEITNLISVGDLRTKMQLKQTVIKQMEKLLFNFVNSIDVKDYYENLSPKYFNVENIGNNNKKDN